MVGASTEGHSTFNEPSPHRILIIHWAWTIVGGAERKLFDIKRALESKGHEVQVFASAHPDNEYTELERFFPPYRDMGRAHFDAEGVRAAVELLYSRPARRGLSALLDEYRPDVALVNTFQHHLSQSVLFELRDRKIPFVHVLSDFKAVCPNTSLLRDGKSCDRCFGGKYYHAVAGKCMKDSAAASLLVALEGYVHQALGVYDIPELLLTPSADSAVWFERGGLPRERLRPFPNAVDLEMWHPDPEAGGTHPRFTMAGRLYPHKGVDVAIKAAASIPESELVVAGEGFERARLEELVESVGASNVRFVGFLEQPELCELMCSSTAVLMPSVWPETFGNTTAEALACGIPVIGSDLGNTPELIGDDERGLVVPAGDVEALARTMQRLMNDREMATEMGRRGREFVEQNHSLDAYTDRLLSVLEEATALHASRTS